jgi:hypothetical protein
MSADLAEFEKQISLSGVQNPCRALRTIEPHYWDTLSLVKLQFESTRNNDSGHPARECDMMESELKMPVDNLASNKKLLGATKSEISSENITVENAPVVEKTFRNYKCGKLSCTANVNRIPLPEAQKR